jgi:siroheme synthase
MIRDQLLATGLAATTPAAAIEWGTCARQRVITCSLVDLPDAIARDGIGAPSIIVIGDVVRLREHLNRQSFAAAGVGRDAQLRSS